MGRTYVFQCSHCEFQTKIVGGADSGFHCAIQTIACADCRKLYDIAVKLRVPENSTKPTALNPLGPPFDPTKLLRYGQPKRTKWLTLPLRCPVGEKHHVEKWQTPGRCPRCGNFMECDGLPYRIWD